ncbi:MAG: efflux transporter outer membrane subunit [Rhodocyclaceae bacterium]|nr:efflux transporter outer membrane subunit [Rhodocyclaceae bacterium]
MRPRRAAAVAATLLLPGCAAVGPDYRRPPLEAPPRWSAGQLPAAAAPGLEQVAWWKNFGDAHLDRLLEQAVDANLDLVQAQARVLQARAALIAAGAARAPQLAASASLARSRSSENSLPGAAAGQVTSLYQGGFDARWEIDLFGGLRRGVEAADARLAASIEQRHATLLTLLAEVARNYLLLRAGQEQLAITRRDIARQQETLAVTRQRHGLGLAPYFDVTLAEAQLAADTANIPAQETAIKAALHRLGVLLGRAPADTLPELATPRPLPQPGALDTAGLPSELLARRPDLRQAERELAAASADVGAALAELYPKFDLTLGLGLQAARPALLGRAASRIWSVVPGLSMSVFDAGRRRALVAGRSAVHDELRAKYQAAFLSALEEVENSLTAFYAEQQRRTLLAEAVTANEQAVALAGERYRRGLTSFLEVLTAQTLLYASQRKLAQSQADLVTGLVALYKALGGGWQAAPGAGGSDAGG